MPNIKTYLVGGAVRDRLLGLEVKERDWVVVGATPEQMRARGFRPVGRDFPVFLHPETGEEYALARTERKSGTGHRGFVFHASPEVTLEEDLERRDLSINAMAEDPEDGSLIDPFGGRDDLEHGLLRHVSAAFVEDPLRVLRVGRFAARFAPRGFRVATDTMKMMRKISASGELQELSAERVWQETERALADAQPRVFIEILRECGALAELFPEIDRLFGVPQPKEYHPEIDTGEHTLLVLAQASRMSSDPAVRFAALVHDLGKGLTPEAEWPSHRGHEMRGVRLVDALGRRLRAPKRFIDLGRITARWHLHAHRARELKPATVMNLFEGIDAFRRPDRLEPFLLACEADARGRTGLEARPYPQADWLRRCFEAARAVSGKDIDGESFEGEALGKELRRQRIEAIRKAVAIQRAP
jgi:tRNA nucleotidyltransferase (CCA-adding enzyme)